MMPKEYYAVTLIVICQSPDENDSDRTLTYQTKVYIDSAFSACHVAFNEFVFQCQVPASRLEVINLSATKIVA